jgi:hypothetical protein
MSEVQQTQDEKKPPVGGVDWETLERALAPGSPVGAHGDKLDPAIWLMRVTSDGLRLLRLHEGRVVESYRFADLREGAVWAAAISQGFEPPRALRGCGTPAG